MDQPVDLSQEAVPQAVSVPAEAYISEAYAKAGREKLWLKVGRVAGGRSRASRQGRHGLHRNLAKYMGTGAPHTYE